ncbi:hypothetical protein C8Q75DRAFT_335656 [Abortiporus biennis]|nr:hypothetical protein C8Q75DRAFT_335656 [Abortiporus biennis]
MASLSSTKIVLDNTVGAVFIGMVVTATLYGITCVQLYMYYMHTGKRDRPAFRTFVAFLWVLDGAQLAFVAHLVYYFVVTNYFNPLALASAPWTGAAFSISSVSLMTISDVLVRCVFVYRVWKLSRSKPLAFGLIFGNLVVGSFGVASASRIQEIGSFQNLKQISWIIYCVFASIACIDSVIAGILGYLFWHLRTGFEHTDSQLEMLMSYSIHTGALTSMIAIIVLITYITTLNARDILRAKLESPSNLTASVQLTKINVTISTDVYCNSEDHTTEMDKCVTFEAKDMERNLSTSDVTSVRVNDSVQC